MNNKVIQYTGTQEIERRERAVTKATDQGSSRTPNPKQASMARRLHKERASLEKAPLPYCTFSLVDESDVHHWRARLTGPPSTPYAGGTFVIDFDFPAQYPFKPPEIKFLTKLYHPNVKTDTGEICSDLIGENWGPTLNVRHCAGVLYSALENPDGEHALEGDIAQLMREKPAEFERRAREWTREHAM